MRTRRSDVRLGLLALAQQRLMLVLLGFAALALLLLLRLAYLGVVEGGGSQRPGQGAHVPARADIVDRNGAPLARTLEARALRVVPQRLINPPDQLADELARIFPDVPRAVLLSRLTAKRPSYLVRRPTPDQLRAVNAIGDIGFEYPLERRRLYPNMALAAHVLGFVDIDGRGKMGMESALDDRLTNPLLRDQPVQLSLDLRVQGVLESELSSAVTNLEAQGAAGIILDVDSGEILAMASLPTFNPNRLRAEDVASQNNAVTFNRYELGSTFKPLAVAAAIDAGTVTSMARRYDATEPLPIAGFLIRDVKPQRRWLNVPETLIHSSNIVTARIADDLGRERMERLFERLEFKSPPHVELNERARPQWPKHWGRVTTMTTAYGHGIAVTPLHLASAYAAMVNGGTWRPATLMKVGQDHPPAAGRRVFTASTSARMRQLLRLIVSDGTGRRADAPGYRVGGKTGSADKAQGGGYARSSVVSTFAAAFPMDRPRYVILVMIDEPKGNAFSSGQRTAGWTAAPVVRDVVLRTGPMLGVVPDTTRDVDVSDLRPLLWKAPGDRP